MSGSIAFRGRQNHGNNVVEKGAYSILRYFIELEWLVQLYHQFSQFGNVVAKCNELMPSTRYCISSSHGPVNILIVVINIVYPRLCYSSNNITLLSYVSLFSVSSTSLVLPQILLDVITNEFFIIHTNYFSIKKTKSTYNCRFVLIICDC